MSLFTVTVSAPAPLAPGRQADLVLVRRALELLADPDDGATVVGINAASHIATGHTLAGRHLDDLTRMAGVLGQTGNVYYCLNPVAATFNRGAGVPNDSEILRRRWLLVDVDTARPLKTKQGATDAERQASRPVATAVKDYLRDRNWPSPLFIDSGNGWHLLYRCDLPNNDYAKRLVKTWLNHLADRFDCEAADVDRVVYPAKQIAKLPGTWAVKGSNLPDRPYRLAAIVEEPGDFSELVTGAMLVALVGEPPGGRRQAQPVSPVNVNGNGQHPPASAGGDTFTPVVSGAPARLAAWCRHALESECAVLSLAVLGVNLNHQLNRSAFRMGQLVHLGLDEREARDQLLAAAQRAGADNPAKDAATLDNGFTAGKENPREAPDFAVPYVAEAALPAAGESLIVRASEITVRRVEWLWPGRIPLGKLTTFAGVGGLGKTFVLCDITARITRGDDWPDGEKGTGEPGQVLFISGEDDPDDTLVPRLIECGANLTKVAFLTASAQGNFTLAAVKVLSMAVGQVGADTRLVVIDPPTSYLGGVNDHKNAELRQLLTPLAAWAGARRISITFNTHVNKPSGTKVEAMMRVMGSVAWVNAVRAAHMFARDPGDPDRRLFLGMKNNLAEEKNGLAYRVVKTPDLAKIEWLGEVDITADEAVSAAGGGKPKRAVLAAEWLEELFAETSDIPSKEVFSRTDAETKLSSDALKEAKDHMGIKAQQRTDGDGKRAWWWFWPTEARQRWAAGKSGG